VVFFIRFYLFLIVQRTQRIFVVLSSSLVYVAVLCAIEINIRVLFTAGTAHRLVAIALKAVGKLLERVHILRHITVMPLDCDVLIAE